jgi:hypothetical protein
VAVCIRYFYKTGQSSFFYSSEKVNWFWYNTNQPSKFFW